ncbi:MAG: DUF1186 domain-containing protein [Desulfobacterales bacterium]
MEPIDTEATATTNDLSKSEILQSFQIIDGVYKQKEIDAAIGLKEEITPHLMAILKICWRTRNPILKTTACMITSMRSCCWGILWNPAPIRASSIFSACRVICRTIAFR